MTTLKIQIVTLLDAISLGLYTFISPHVITIGGNHSFLGLLTISLLLCQLISNDIVKIFINVHGRKTALFIILIIALFTHLVIAQTTSYWLVFFARCLFSLTNQAQHIFQKILLDETDKENHDYYLTTSSILSSCGYLIGPIITGCLFDIGFSYSCILAAVLTSVNVAILSTISSSNDNGNGNEKHEPFIRRIANRITRTLDKYIQADIVRNWDVILTKLFFSTSVGIFFTKYTQILKHNLLSDSVTTGLIMSYMNALSLIFTYISALLDESVLSIQCALIFFILSLSIACFTTLNFMYLVICIPVIFLRHYLNSIFKHLFDERENDHLSHICDSLGILADLTVPLIFGILRDSLGYYTVIFFSIAPLILSLFIMEKYVDRKEVGRMTREKEL